MLLLVMMIRRLLMAAFVLAVSLRSAAPLAAQDLPDWAPPAWLHGSWGLSEHGAVFSVVASPGNIVVTMTVDGTRVVFDAQDTAAGGTRQVKGSSGLSDTGLLYYEVSVPIAGGAFAFMFYFVSDTALVLLSVRYRRRRRVPSVRPDPAAHRASVTASG